MIAAPSEDGFRELLKEASSSEFQNISDGRFEKARWRHLNGLIGGGRPYSQSLSSPWHFEYGEGDVPGDASRRVGGGAAVHAHVLARHAVDDEAVDPRPAVLAGGEAADGDALLGGGGEVARVRLGPRHLGRGHAARSALERRGLAAPHRDVLCEGSFNS